VRNALHGFDCVSDQVQEHLLNLYRVPENSRQPFMKFQLEPHVTFHAEVGDAELAGLYRGAAAFVTTSEHEGFCVPVIEAMAFGVPVVALAATALPETVGDAGLLWEARDPRPFAASLARLMREPEAHQLLASAGRERYARRFTNEAIEGRLAEVVAGLA
jgi:glycosyltransferase involved in cell wall biosynthesis